MTPRINAYRRQYHHWLTDSPQGLNQAARRWRVALWATIPAVIACASIMTLTTLPFAVPAGVMFLAIAAGLPSLHRQYAMLRLLTPTEQANDIALYAQGSTQAQHWLDMAVVLNRPLRGFDRDVMKRLYLNDQRNNASDASLAAPPEKDSHSV